MKQVVLFLLATVIISSCHRIHEGTVTEKYVVPAHYYHYTTTQFVGKTPIITSHTGYVGDEYVLTVSGIDGKDTVSEEFSVDYATFECKSIGTYFNDTMPCEPYEPK